MIFPSRERLPSSLYGYACWLQLWYDGRWVTLARLGRSSARDLVRWLERHPDTRQMRVWIEKV
jgi:hypothetical protein